MASEQVSVSPDQGRTHATGAALNTAVTNRAHDLFRVLEASVDMIAESMNQSHSMNRSAP